MPYLNFSNSINISAQIGDLLYCLGDLGVSVSGGFSVSNQDPEMFGIITNIDNSINQITYNETDYFGNLLNTPLNVSGGNPFVMFQKNQSVNTSGLKGYYAEVKFVNNSTEKAELFSVGAEVDESSK
jgi:hypothetical protein